MYVKRICDKNVGPIEQTIINFPFTSEGNPKPTIIVGENGTGKSILLSNLVDALYEMAAKAFSNVEVPVGNNMGSYQYYKPIQPIEIHTGKKYLYSYIEFDDNFTPNNLIQYIFKSGSIDYNTIKNEINTSNINGFSWKDSGNQKHITASKEQTDKIFSHDVLCFFSPDRYEKPIWLGKDYYNSLSQVEHPTIQKNLSGYLNNPISVKNMTNFDLQWLLDLIVDSRCDVDFISERNNNAAKVSIGNFVKPKHVLINNLLALSLSRKLIENIMSEILGENVYFALSDRSNKGGSRFSINLSKDESVIIPTLDSLSTGQSALFNMFATIVRYADNNNVNNSFKLENIIGIVIIDEIELHLHSNLQASTLPKLIKLFPKIQFIVTTHSPLFLLGMDKEFGANGYEIYEMPTGKKITSEKFAEFGKAYKYLCDTETHANEIHHIIQETIDKQEEINSALIITEGASDWKHMKSAWESLLQDDAFSEKYRSIKFSFLEFESKKVDDNTHPVLQMSNSELVKMCEDFAKIHEPRKMIFIADADDEATTKKLTDNKKTKEWGNNVYSLVLPVPENRMSTPQICIEHYYADEDIKTTVEISGISRRIYMGDEFDNDGESKELHLRCRDEKHCGENYKKYYTHNQRNICIIDGTCDKRVWDITNPNPQKPNLALSKMEFANHVLEGKGKFEKFKETSKLSSFKPLFQAIQKIIDG